jgi:DNA-binding GntR family transcriptional regulator
MPDAALLPLPPTARQTLGESVAASLRAAIFNGVLKPGDRIAQAQVANELGVSQAPVRDALSTLEREGLVERSANNGAVVALLSAADIEEICSLRMSLETLGLRLALQRATAADLDSLEDNIRSTEEVHTPGEAAILDLRFHESLMRLAGHGRLLSCWQTLLAQLKLALVQQDRMNPDYSHQVADCHRNLLAQIRAGNETEAVALLVEQLERFRDCARKLNTKLPRNP